MSTQIAVRIPDALIGRLDDVVASGRFETRADAVRAALDALLEAERRAEVGRRIVAGYLRAPLADAAVGAAGGAAATSLEDEPW